MVDRIVYSSSRFGVPARPLVASGGSRVRSVKNFPAICRSLQFVRAARDQRRGSAALRTGEQDAARTKSEPNASPPAKQSLPFARALNSLAKPGQSSVAAFGGAIPDRSARADRPLQLVEDFRCPRWPDPAQKLQDPKARNAILIGFSTHRKTLITSLTWAASRNLRPPYLTNGMFRRASSISSWALWWDARNRTACDLRDTPSSRAFEIWSATYRA